MASNTLDNPEQTQRDIDSYADDYRVEGEQRLKNILSTENLPNDALKEVIGSLEENPELNGMNLKMLDAAKTELERRRAADMALVPENGNATPARQQGNPGRVTRNTDGDTLTVKTDNSEESIRILGTDTDELGTDSGDAQAEYMSKVIPEGSSVSVDGYEKDVFKKRRLGSVSRNINGVDIDMGLVSLHQGFSNYFVQYGRHPDPMKDEQYKAYFSDYAPLQYGESFEPLNGEEVAQMQAAEQALQVAMQAGDQRSIDTALVDLYGDPNKLVRYTKQISDLETPSDTFDGGIKSAFKFMIGQDPSFKQRYNKAMLKAGNTNVLAYDRDPTWWEALSASNEQYSMVANMIEASDLWITDNYAPEMEVPMIELTKGVPEELKTLVVQKAATEGGTAGLLYRDQIIEDAANEKLINNLPMYAQVGYGIGGYMLDPLAIASAVPVGAGANIATAAIRTWQVSTSTKVAANLGVWATSGAIDGAIYAGPRLSADHTYNVNDYALDVVTDATFGTVLGGAFMGGSKLIGYRKEAKAARQKEIEEIANKGEQLQIEHLSKTEKQPDFEPILQLEYKPEAAANAVETVNNWTEEAATVPNEGTYGIDVDNDLTVDEWTGLNKVDNKGNIKNLKLDESGIPVNAPVKQSVRQKYAPLGAVNKVSQKGYRKALDTISTTFPPNSVMHKVLNTQKGINNKAKDPEVRKEADKLNATVLKIAAQFPNGKVPKDVEAEIAAVMWKQKLARHEPAMEKLLKGDTADMVGTLEDYIKVLKGQEQLWEGLDPVPVSREDFIEANADLLGLEGKFEDIPNNFGEMLPKEVKFIEDVIKLNEVASNNYGNKFTQLVEELNGLVAARLEQKALFGDTPRYKDSNTNFAKKVSMTAPEAFAQAKSEGLTPKTPEFKARMQELKKSGLQVSENVREFGRADDFAVGGRDADKSKRYDKDSDIEEIESQSIDQDTFAEDSVFATKGSVTQDFSDEAVGKLMSVKTVGSLQDEPLNKAVSYNEFGMGEDVFNRAQRSDNLEQDLLPRSYTKYETQEAYKDLTKDSLKDLNRRLNEGVGKKLGINKLDNVDIYSKKERLSAIKMNMLKDRAKVIDRMVGSRSMDALIDVLRVSEQIATEARKALDVKKVETKETSNKEKVAPIKEDQVTTDEVSKPKAERIKVAGYDYESLSKPLTEEEVDVYVNEPEKMTTSERASTKKRLNAAVDFDANDSAEKVSGAVAKFIQSGQQEAFRLARKSVGAVDYVGKMAGRLTQDLTTVLQDSGVPSLEWFGSMIPESARGYGGTMKRKFTGAIIKDAKYKESIMQIMPNYVQTMDAYAAESGMGAIRRTMAQQKSGETNSLVNKFNREVFTVQELRRQGKPTGDISPTVLKFVDDFDKYMEWNHNALVEANVGGFTKQRKVKNYIPHVWQVGKLKGAESKYGANKVREVFAKAYMNASGVKIKPTREQALQMADDQIKWIKKQEMDADDQFVPTADSRAKQRKELDTTTEIDGLSILDLLDTEVASITTKYSNRVGGWIGLSESTGGALAKDTDIDALRSLMKEEGATADQVQWFDDTIDMMMGRPVRGGLDERLRNFKDATALTRMGGLGMAQAIETGQVITRSTFNLFSQPQVIGKIFKMANESPDDKELMTEIMSISNLTNDIEWLDRQSVHLDQHEVDKSSKARALSLKIADISTGGSLKAPASRLLGKTSGYNMVRRYQSRVVQASFINDSANHFVNGTGKMSNARRADVGLTDVNGGNDALRDAFKKYAEFDNGELKKLNIEKWPKQQREELQFAMIRDEAQQIQRTMIGEAPPWMNKPLLALVAQFREMAIVAQNKQLARSMAFADVEAVTAVMLNASIAGMVRYAKFAGLAAGTTAITKQEWEEPTEEQMQVDKYITQFGIFSDAYDLVLKGAQVGEDGKFDRHDIDRVMGEIPVYGLMKDYANVGYGGNKGRLDATQGITPLGNTALGDHMFTLINEMLEEL